MQKSALVVGSGVVIIIGLFLLVFGNQDILEGITQDNGKVSSEQALSISNNFDSQTTSVGVFAVQIIEFEENTFSAKILDPFDIEIISQEINDETIEEDVGIAPDSPLYGLDIAFKRLNLAFTFNKERLVEKYFSWVK